MYSESIRMEALQKLAENDGNLKKTAKETGVSRPSLANWKRQHGEEYIRLKEERQEKHVKKIFGVREKALKVIEEKLPEASAAEAAMIYDKLTMKELLLRGELIERHKVEVNVEGTIDIRAVTDRTEERLRLLDKLSSRGRSGVDMLSISGEPDGTPEVSDSRDTKLFVYHEQGEPEAASMVEQDTEEVLSSDRISGSEGVAC